jgi:hypothetical protein
MFGFRYEKKREKYLSILEEFQKVVVNVSEMEEFNNRDDFIINIQPFLRKVIFPHFENGNTDFSYMSYDCFHLSQKGYALAANALWNNMMEPYANKSENLPPQIFKPFLCPTKENPYIRTRLN